MMGILMTASSCGDMLDQDSTHVIYAEDSHLDSEGDTLYSVIGIINTMQTIADRTILLGELRGDLVDVRSSTDADLREISNFAVSDDNEFNVPSDYYAVINNCNYFIANADTALKNNRNEYIFQKEYAAVKGFRAWTYLQLVLNYGKVPYVTDPILTKDESEADYPEMDITTLCETLIDDIEDYATVETPDYGTIRNTDSELFYFPIYVLLGDLNLWAGNYREAALCYYNYISSRNGDDSAYPITTDNVEWGSDDTKWERPTDNWSDYMFNDEDVSSTGELITMIPGDSIPSEGNYSQLRNYFNSNSDNEYEVSIVASQGLLEISQAQTYCKLNSSYEVTYAPSSMDDEENIGDLRYQACYNQRSSYNVDGNSVDDYTQNSKYVTRNVHIYRRAHVYLRMAEALNRAGFPRFAFAILKTGVDNDVMEEDILPYYPDDEAYLSQFDFNTSDYVIRTRAESSSENTMGIHSRGSGWSEYNEYYEYPENEELSGTEAEEYEIEAVEDLIITEDALETAFEGNRFYDLMRVALRRNDPTYLADKVYNRRGADNVAEMKSLIEKDLTVESNWYLNWNGEIGLGEEEE